MFKAYTQRDWAIFTQTYGQPLRIGKFGAGATEGDKDTLFRAVANIAGDCAAIVPESMTIDFIESKNVGPGSELYLQRSDWLDRQISKAVLGQTTTTDAVSGGHAVSKEHRLVQEDIERADARVLQGILNRDLIRPWVDLEYGPQARYPRLRIARPEAEDLKQLAESLNILVPLGVRVSMSEVRDRFGLADPGPDDEILVPRAAPAPPAAPAPGAPGQDGPMKAVSAEIKGGAADPGTEAPQMEDGAPGAVFGGVSPEALLADRLAVEAQPAVGEMMARIEAMVEAAQDMDELREMFLAAFPKLDASGLANALALGLLAAQGAGRAEVVGEDG
jgi:phage gp29-like protein